ncbi:MAG: uncharacterized protein QG635_1145 [Bacteroidota bacterium]|nr:uncharacterized protein [Bacteroidota bacterium]
MSENITRSNAGLIIFGAVLAAGLILSSFIIGDSIVQIKRSNQFISVKGYADKNIKSDIAVWTCEVTASSIDLISGFNKLQSDLKFVIKYLDSVGITNEGIDISSISTSKRFRLTETGMETGEFLGYNLFQSITVRTKNIDLISKVSKESTNLIKNGIDFISLQPRYSFTGLNNIKIEMLGQAARDAKTRAQKIAESSGARIIGLKSASQGIFQITPPYSNQVSDYGINDESSIDKSIKAVVTMEYFIK